MVTDDTGIAAVANEIAEAVMGNPSVEHYLDDAERDELRSDIAIEAVRVMRSIFDENAKMREALAAISEQCDEEIKVRSAGVSEAKLKNMRVLALLRLPRDIARAALSAP